MLKEIWKDIYEYDGFYQVSNLGNIRSRNRIITRIDGTKYFRRGMNIKSRVGKDGNVRVNLSIDGVKRIHSLARVVYKAFNLDFDYYDNSLIVAHKNNSTNNELENLYIIKRNDIVIANGDESRIEKRKVKCITTGKIFESISDAERYYNIKTGSGSISRCCSGKQNHAVILEDGVKLEWEYIQE